MRTNIQKPATDFTDYTDFFLKYSLSFNMRKPDTSAPSVRFRAHQRDIAHTDSPRINADASGLRRGSRGAPYNQTEDSPGAGGGGVVARALPGVRNHANRCAG